MITGTGRDIPSLILVGDYATKEDVINDNPISGQHYNILSNLFRESNIRIEDTYRTILIKEGLPYYGKARKRFNDGVSQTRLKIHPRTYESILYDEILAFNPAPSLVVPLGDLALRALVESNVGIKKLRGSLLNIHANIQAKSKSKIYVVPILGPKYILEDNTCRSYTQLDVSKIARYLKEGVIEYKENVWVISNSEQLRNFINKHISNCEFLTFDIETHGGVVTCISFCFDGKEAVSVPLLDASIDPGNMHIIWTLIARLLASPIPKVNQNIKFDWIILERFGFRVNNIIGDTMLAAHTLYPELPKGLDFLTSIYTSIPYYKDEGKEYDPKIHSKSRFYLYNAKDALATHQIYSTQLVELEEEGLLDFYKKRVMPCFFVYKKLDQRGIRVDLTRRDTLISKYTGFRDLFQLELNKLVGRSINARSNQQVGKLVYEELKFPKHIKQTDSGVSNYNTSEEILEELMINHSSKKEYTTILENIIGVRKLEKLLEYLNTPIHPDGYFRTSYKLHGTETGRTSGGRSLDSLYSVINKDGKIKWIRTPLGGSLQTLPKHGFRIGSQTYGKDLRTMYVAPAGYRLIEGDYSQAEARVVAVLSEDYALLPVFDAAPGVHCLTGSWIFGCDPNDIKKGTDDYHLSKTVRHAGNYNMGPGRLSLMTHLPMGICRQKLEIFHQYSPKIRGIFHHDVYTYVQKHRQLTNPFGRRRQFFGRLDDSGLKEALATIPQSTVSDKTKFSLVELDELMPWATFIYEGHDALLAEVPIGREKEFAENFKLIGESPIDFSECSLSRDFKLSIPVELEIGDNWGEMERLVI